VAQCDQQQPYTKTPTLGCDHASKAFLQVTTEPQYLTNWARSSPLTDQLTQAGEATSAGVTEQSSSGSRLPGFLSATNQQQCGTSTCPWKLQAEPGQRINITLIHFSTTPLDGTKSAPSPQNQAQSLDRQMGSLAGVMGTQGAVACHRFASVTEPISTNGRGAALPSFHDLTACGFDQRTSSTTNDDLNSSEGAWLEAISRGTGKNEKHIYLSDSNSLRLEFYPHHGLHVIIRYQGEVIVSFHRYDIVNTRTPSFNFQYAHVCVCVCVLHGRILELSQCDCVSYMASASNLSLIMHLYFGMLYLYIFANL